MSEQNKINISFRISSIKTLKFYIDNLSVVANAKNESFEFNISLAVFIDSVKNNVGFDIVFDVYSDKSKSIQLCELITRTEYNIINFQDVIKPKSTSNQFEIPDQFMLTLVSIALSTTRGIFAAKIEGSALSNVIMPVVDPKTFIKISPPGIKN